VSRTVGRKRAAAGIGKPGMGGAFGGSKLGGGGAGRRADGGGETLQTDKKVLHLAWHPERDVLAIAGLNRLYFYTV
jgi:hypothetical protein